MKRVALVLVGAYLALLVAWAVWLRPLIDGPPLFVLEHEIEFVGTPQEAWDVLVDADRHAEWNPYLLELAGDLAPGGEITIVIAQENWETPMTLPETLVVVEAPHVLHWRGELWPPGLMTTDHSFWIERIGDDRVRFTQREEFRGLVPRFLDAEARGHTERAFRAMDEALAARVAALRAQRAP